MQHSEAGGFSDAPRSPSGIVAGRWKTHTLSCESTATPPTCPVTHLFGNACDQSGSGSNIGTCPARFCAHTETAMRSATMITMYFFMRSPRSYERHLPTTFTITSHRDTETLSQLFLLTYPTLHFWTCLVARRHIRPRVERVIPVEVVAGLSVEPRDDDRIALLGIATRNAVVHRDGAGRVNRA